MVLFIWVKELWSSFQSKLSGLRLKIILTYLIMTIIPITIIEVSIYFLWLNMERQNIINFNQKYLYIEKQSLENEFSKLAKINSTFFSNAEIHSLLLNIDKSKNYEYDRLKIQRFFNSTLILVGNINTDIFGLTFFGINDEMLYSNVSFIADYSPADEIWFKQIKSARGNPVIFDQLISFSTDKRKNSISIGQLMKSPNDMQTLGVALVSYDISILQRLFNPLKYNESSSSLLVNPSGRIIYSSDRKFNNDYLSDEIMWKINGGKKEYFFAEINGQKNLIMFSEILPYRWKILSVFPENKIYQTINNYLIRINILILFIIYIFALITLYRFNKELKPLYQIAVMMEKNVTNNFKTDYDIPNTNREILMLNKSFKSMTRKIDDLIEKEYVAKIKKKEAEINALEMQINPHFLYNTLEIIRWMAVENKQEKISKMIYALSSNLRYSITNTGEKVKIRDEINWLENYLYIQTIRFDDRFEAFFEIEESILDMKFHKLILQPFIENSIVHGFKDTLSGGKITIKGWKEPGELKFSIADNGAGFPEGNVDMLIHPDNMGDFGLHSVGLSNAVKRIHLYYEEYNVRIVSREGEGTLVEIIIKTEVDGYV